MSWGVRVWLWSLAPSCTAAGLVLALRAGGEGWAWWGYGAVNALVTVLGLAAIARDRGERVGPGDVAEGAGELLVSMASELPFAALAILSAPFVYLWGRLFRGAPWVHEKVPPAYMGLSLGFWLSLPALGAWLLFRWLRSLPSVLDG